jgi:hypothetical protein
MNLKNGGAAKVRLATVRCESNEDGPQIQDAHITAKQMILL